MISNIIWWVRSLSFLVLRVGGVGDWSVYIEVLSGIPGGLSLCFCVVGEDGDMWEDLECLVPKFVRSERLLLLVWRVGGGGASSIHIEVFLGVPGGLLLCLCVSGRLWVVGRFGLFLSYFFGSESL